MTIEGTQYEDRSLPSQSLRQRVRPRHHRAGRGKTTSFSGINPNEASLSVELMQGGGQDRGWDPGAVFQYKHTPHLKHPSGSSYVEFPSVFLVAITHL